MNSRYQVEIDEFEERFADFKNAAIVLYGIGRYTSTLLEGAQGFRFVGLMDKDPANVGKQVFGLPVLDQKTAEETADLVIINTSETYWDVIYDRIKDIKIPVWFKNGVRAEKKQKEIQKYPFGELSYKELNRAIEKAAVLSFDFFDTLFMRSVCSPQDVFRLLEAGCPDFLEKRNRAKEHLKGDYSLDELYREMVQRGDLTDDQAGILKKQEVELEKKLLIPRPGILQVLQTAYKSRKEVYIVSDMYLPKSFYLDVLNRYEIYLQENRILISNELHKSKSDGTMWQYYAKHVSGTRPALHIGDDIKADVEMPLLYGIKTYHVPGVWELFGVSSMRGIMSRICSEYAQAVMGCVLSGLTADPYALAETNGMIRIPDHYRMGYCVFGPVVLAFLLWLKKKSETDGVKRLLFLSRDGYFLKEDFEYLCSRQNVSGEADYLGISRQLAMSASVTTWEELLEYASMPYTGTVSELFEDRFGITGVSEKPGYCMEDYLRENMGEIKVKLREIRENYLRYLDGKNLTDDCAVVDLGFYGNNQRYLNRLTGRKIAGYYFNANLSSKNPNTKDQKMTACFQAENDVTAENSKVLKKMIYLESFLTAPYGMVKAIDEQGEFLCAEKKQNQKHFREKEEMNRGVKALISDYVERFGEFDLYPDVDFTDRYYGLCMGGALEFSEEVKQGFYNDNAMMNRIESMLFY